MFKIWISSGVFLIFCGNVDCGSYCCTSPSGYTYCEYGCCASWYDYYERCCSYNETIASPSTMYVYSNLNNGTGYNSNSKERTNITFWIVPIVVCVTVSIVTMVTKCGRSKSTKKIMPTTVATAVKDPIETFTIKQVRLKRIQNLSLTNHISAELYGCPALVLPLLKSGTD
ncbi:hypothetical protein BgiMline_002955 [Biomphalaria glabrata]